jgi:hypothetical protein
MTIYRTANISDYADIAAFLEKQNLKYSEKILRLALLDKKQAIVFGADVLLGVTGIIAIAEEEIDLISVREEEDLELLLSCAEEAGTTKGFRKLSMWTQSPQVEEGLKKKNYTQTEEFCLSRRYEKKL